MYFRDGTYKFIIIIDKHVALFIGTNYKSCTLLENVLFCGRHLSDIKALMRGKLNKS